MTPGTTEACWAAHLGLMAIEPRFLRSAVAMLKAGAYVPRAQPVAASSPGSADVPGDGLRPYYALAGDGVAVVRIAGPMAKSWGKMGEHSTVFTRRAIRAATADPKVSSVLLVLDSPGGHVAGTQDLVDDVLAARAAGLPVHAFIEDLGASAAYWVASAAGKVYATATSFVGSIGILAVVYDSSKAAEIAGVEVHVLSTGPLKGAGADGAPVTDAMLASWQSEVDAVMIHFRRAVMSGREMSAAAFAAVSTGGVWMADEAKRLGLIDGVRTLDDVIAGMPKRRRYRAAASLEIERERAAG